MVSEEQMDDVREDVLGAILMENKEGERRDILRLYDLQLSQATDKLLLCVEACETFRTVRYPRATGRASYVTRDSSRPNR